MLQLRLAHHRPRPSKSLYLDVYTPLYVESSTFGSLPTSGNRSHCNRHRIVESNMLVIRRHHDQKFLHPCATVIQYLPWPCATLEAMLQRRSRNAMSGHVNLGANVEVQVLR
jgi:hypothetical protein